MIFQVGKTYCGYTVESRTKCFVTFEGVSRKKISLSADGVEQVRFEGVTRVYADGSKTEIEAFTIAAFEEVEVFEVEEIIDQPEVSATESPMSITPSTNPIVTPQPVSGDLDGEPIIVIDSTNQQWRLVDADTQNCLFEAVEHREIGCSPRTRTMPLKQLQALYGWGEPKRDPHVRPSYMGIGIEVHCGDEANGFALAELIWAERDDDPDWAELERERAQRMWDRDESRAMWNGTEYRRSLV